MFISIQIIGGYYINGTNVFPRICGDELPGEIVTPANIMYVRFVTDDFYSRKGFVINGEFKYGMLMHIAPN